MNKGIVTPLLGLMVVGLIALSLAYYKPTQLFEANQAQQTFFSKTEQKKQLTMFLASQAATEALADIALEKKNSCALNELNTQDISQKMTEYFSSINNIPEINGCTLSLESIQINPQGDPINPPFDVTLNANFECTTQITNPTNPNQTTTFLQAEKKFVLNKSLRLEQNTQSNECKIIVTDKDTLETFTQ